MKKLRIVRYLAYFVIILILISVLPEGVLSARDSSEQGIDNQNQYIRENFRDSSANETDNEIAAGNLDSDPEKFQDNLSVKDQNRISEHTQEIEQTKEEFQLHKREYQTAKENFLKIKSRILSGELDPNSEEALQATKIYLSSSINYMISHLSNVKRSMEFSKGAETEYLNGTETEYLNSTEKEYLNSTEKEYLNSTETEDKIIAVYEKIKLLESEKAKVVNASSQKELLSTVRSVSEIWNDAQKISLAGSGEIVSEKIEEFLEKSRTLSEKLDVVLENMNETGVETSDFETKLTSYNSYLTSAQEKKENADSIYESENVTRENMEMANNQLRQSINDINKANKILKELFDKLKKYETELTNLTEVGNNLNADSNDTNYANITANDSSAISDTPVN
jgi:hypothetical protein